MAIHYYFIIINFEMFIEDIGRENIEIFFSNKNNFLKVTCRTDK